MMSEEQRFIFDVQGYLVVEGALGEDRLARMRAEMDRRKIAEPGEDLDLYRWGGFLGWGEDWRTLIDHPRLLPVLEELLGPKFRLDHAYGMAARANGGRSPQELGLHHAAGMFDHGCYYTTHGTKMHNGLIVVSYALTDIAPGAGGFCCIPGSHKANFKMPNRWYSLDDNPLARQVPQKAGDAVVFTESLTHGTWPWTNPRGERRSVLLKYCPHYMQWASTPMESNIDALTERQRAILQPAYVWQRPRLALD